LCTIVRDTSRFDIGLLARQTALLTTFNNWGEFSFFSKAITREMARPSEDPGWKKGEGYFLGKFGVGPV